MIHFCLEMLETNAFQIQNVVTTTKQDKIAHFTIKLMYLDLNCVHRLNYDKSDDNYDSSKNKFNDALKKSQQISIKYLLLIK